MFQASLVSLAFVCRYQSDMLNLAIFALTLTTIAASFTYAGRRGWRIRTTLARDAEPSALTRFAGRLKRRAVLTRAPTLFAAISMPLFALYSVTHLDAIPADGRTTGLALWGCALAATFWHRQRAEFALIERLILYVAVTTAVFYWCVDRQAPLGLASPENLYFFVLGASVAIACRFGRNRSFDVTPTDFLIILIALIVPTLTRTLFQQHYVGEVAIKTLVLFYAAELVLAESRKRLWAVRLGVCVVLSVLAIRLLYGNLEVIL